MIVLSYCACLERVENPSLPSFFLPFFLSSFSFLSILLQDPPFFLDVPLARPFGLAGWRVGALVEPRPV